MAHDLLTAVPLSIIAATVLALVARTAGQPLILGYIAAGIVLGDHLGLAVVTDEASIEAIAEIGLIFLLFIIGLEVSIPRLLQAGRTIVVAGLLQVPICAALAWWGLGWITGASDAPLDRLYLAVALSLSSTLIVVKLLSDKFEIATLGGKVTLGILIFQDLWAIAFMAVQPSLTDLRAIPLLRSLAAGVLVLAAAALLSRMVLPGLFRAISGSHELVLITAVAWCFLLAGTAGWAGLSKEMGALIAGLVLASFPYGVEVTSRLSGVRDFFVTLFFVTLGLKAPAPSASLLVLAGVCAVAVVLTRAVALYPLFRVLRVDTRTAGVVTVNLSQVSEFSLVIVGLGATAGHVSPQVASLVLYTLLLTAVLSTYGIFFNHAIATRVARLLALTGVPRWAGGTAPESAPPAGHRDVVLLGVFREAQAFLERLEREAPALKARIVAIDFNPETLERLQASGVACHYGDISNLESLHHAGVDRAAVVVSSIPDTYLRGTDNLRLLRLVRFLAPDARVVVTAETAAQARDLHASGADDVVVPSALAGEHLYRVLFDPSAGALADGRRPPRLAHPAVPRG